MKERRFWKRNYKFEAGGYALLGDYRLWEMAGLKMGTRNLREEAYSNGVA
jgi:hypothetical protein